MKLTINRSRWLRGEEDSLLLNEFSQMCCVGFYAKALGVPDEAIRNVAALIEVIHPANTCDWGDTDDMAALYELNDCNPVGFQYGSTREIAIAAIFAKHDVEVEFVD